MILLDTNLLVYAHRSAVPEHSAARRAIEQACEDERGCGLSLPSVAEFLCVVTHPTASGRPSKPAEAERFLREVVDGGGVRIWTPAESFALRLTQLATDMQVSGPRIFDLQIALIGFDNGATEVWTHDRRFLAPRGLRVRDPLS